MKKACLNNLQYLLVAILMMALTGCGASNSAIKADGSTQGGAAKIAVSYPVGKTVADLAPGAVTDTAVTGLQFTVTGTGLDGKAIPVVRGTSTSVNGGSITGIYPGTVTVAVKAVNAGGQIVYEGYKIALAINAGVTTDAGTITMAVPLTKAQDVACVNCHELTLDNTNGQNLVADFKQSGHYKNTLFNYSSANFPQLGRQAGCAGCHGPSHNDLNPAASGRCADCHQSQNTNHATSYTVGKSVPAANTCGACHRTHNFTLAVKGCVGCHSVPQNAAAYGTFVNDNNGVRSITQEFGKWSHHVTGVKLNNAHCAACHLEGTVVNGAIAVDPSKHMADAKTHLRNGNTDADMVWDPANPNFSNMDNFCMSCHDANGANSPMSLQIQAVINNTGIAAQGKTASPSNPFGDTISNRYDKLQRPAVVDVSDQFNTSNNSHHGVKGARYSGRTRFTGKPGGRVIGSPSTFAQNSSSVLWGTRSTIYDAGNFNAAYVPLGTDGTAATGLGDDSTLHCGDCHTVGQWKPGSTVNMAGQATTVAIGAHGAQNEYLLRNNLGTDARHSGVAYTVSAGIVTVNNPNSALLVCFNCHTYSNYGSIYNATGQNFPSANLTGISALDLSRSQPHAGEYASGGRCNGPGNTIPFNGYTTGTATDGTQFASRFMGPVSKYGGPAQTGEQNPQYGNVFGIQCLNCHNSGYGNAYGGIHGSANNTSWNNGTTTINPDPSVTGGAYIDGVGNTTKVERFLPGLNDAMHVPGTLGGYTGGTVVPAGTANGGVGYTYAYTTGGITNDANWEQKNWNQQVGSYTNTVTRSLVGGSATGAGCYTLGANQVTGANIKKSDVTSGLLGPSVTGANGAATEATDTWGGCDDHTAGQAKGNHGFFKRIVRPVTY